MSTSMDPSTLSRLRAIRAVLFDLNGTVHVGARCVGGSPSALSALSSADVPLRFVSNTSKESREALLRKVVAAGLGSWVTEDVTFTSLSAAASEVRTRGVRNPLLLLSASAKEDLAREGIASDEAAEHDAVVIGLAPEQFDYNRLNKAFHVIMRGGGLIAAHKGRYLATEEGTLALGPGAFVSALEYSAGVQARVVGKPSKAFFDRALESFGIPDLERHQVAMVGDDYRDDCLAAKEQGFFSVLVRTGKYCHGDETKGDSPVDLVVDDVLAFADLLLASREMK